MASGSSRNNPGTAEDFNWAIGGEAGDGVASTGKIFTRAVSRAGRYAFTYKDFASRIRGGYTAYHVRSAVSPVESVVDRIDVLVALTERTVEENADELHPESVIIYDKDSVDLHGTALPNGATGVSIPLRELASEAGGEIMQNIVALGAVSELANLPIEYLDEALEKRFRDKGEAIIADNKNAARRGKQYLAEFGSSKLPQYELETTNNDFILLNGAEAIGVGAIAAGCQFYSGYPITPATNVMEFLAGRLEEFGGIVIQAEDELAAINHTLGAARAGARAMTATSGPGIDLMAESLGLVGMTETPLVIANLMRAGPSSGMATKQEQSDLTMMLYGGHGEIPRFVITPTTIADTFHKTVEAFNLAEKYQIPVILSIDLAMAVTEQTVDPEEFDADDIEIDRGKLVRDDGVAEWQDDQERFQPHLSTEDGISPRTVPGTEGGIHMSTGLEHNELGRRTEDVDDRVEQVDKRERKIETARRREDFAFREFGDVGADTLVISWGSTEGAMVEAIEYLAEDDIAVRFLSVPYIYPRPNLTEAVADSETVIVAETNATGQFADLVEHDTLERVERINKYTGVRFKADELAENIKEILGESSL